MNASGGYTIVKRRWENPSVGDHKRAKKLKSILRDRKEAAKIARLKGRHGKHQV